MEHRSTTAGIGRARHRHRARFLVALLLATTCVLSPGCRLSDDSFSLMPSEFMSRLNREESPEIVRSDTTCRVEAVGGNFVDPGGDDAVHIGFSWQPTVHGHSDLAATTATPAARMTVRPPPEGSWLRLPGAGLFRPLGWHFRAFHATWFREASASVETTFTGLLRRSQVATRIPTAELPLTWRAAPPIGPQEQRDLGDCLSAFARHDWVALLDEGPRLAALERTPLAFLDPRGRVVSPAEMAQRLETARFDPERAADIAGYTLLGKQFVGFGKEFFVRVPLPLLIQGEELELRPVTAGVEWTRRQVWRGEIGPIDAVDETGGAGRSRGDGLDEEVLLVPGAPAQGAIAQGSIAQALPATGIPLDSPFFVYTYGKTDRGATLVPAFFKTLLAVPLATLDWIFSKSAWYANLRSWMAGRATDDEEEWSPPQRR